MVGGKVSEGSDIYFCFYIEKAHFVMVSGLLVFLFVKLLYYKLNFSKIAHTFYGSTQPASLKIAMYNSIDVRVMSCLFE